MDNNNNLQQNILDKIKAGEIKMKSKHRFVLHVIGLIILAALVLLTSSFLISFIIYGIQVSGKLLLLGFGLRGFGIFFLTFPWFVLLIDIIFIVLLEWLLKHFQFGYRYPLVYTFGGIILVTIGVGFIIDKTPLHSFIFQEEQHRPVPIIGGFYAGLRRPPHESGVFRGTVISLNANTFIMMNGDPDDVTVAATYEGTTTTIVGTSTASINLLFKVFLDPSVSAASILAPGDVVFVAGDISGNTIHAYGIKKLLPSDDEM